MILRWRRSPPRGRMDMRNSERSPNNTPRYLREWGPATMYQATSLPSTAARLISRAHRITSPMCKQTSCLCRRAWGRTTPSSRRMCSITWARIGSHPLYELPFTGGFPDNFGRPPDAFEDGEIGKLKSIVPGSGPRGVNNQPQAVGDNPNLPRDPDKFDADVDAQREFRQRGVPSG